MKDFVYKQTLLCLFLFASCLVWGQNSYNPSVKPATLTLEGKSLSGFTTHFDFDREAVRYGWWTYARNFGNPLNMKTYYKVTVPSSTNEGNTDLVIFTQATPTKGGVDFFLGVAEEKYKDQARSLLSDFKKWRYIDNYLHLIDDKESEAKDLSSAYLDAILEEEKSELLNSIAGISIEIENLKEEIRKVENN